MAGIDNQQKGMFSGLTDLITTIKNLVISANTINQTIAKVFPSWTSGQIPGAPSNGDALAGNIGEYMSSTILVGAAVALGTGVTSNVTSITLTPGDWDVWGNVAFTANAATTATAFQAALSTATGALPTAPGVGAYAQLGISVGAGGVEPIMPVGMTRLSISTNTPVYLVAQSTFAVNTMSAFGFIGARRRR